MGHKQSRAPPGAESAGCIHDAPPVLLHESIGNLAMFAQGAGRANLVETHEPRVASHVSGDYGCEPASDAS